MKTINVKIPQFNEIEIVLFADEHNGNEHFDRSILEQKIEYVKTHENAFALLNGDIMEIATKNSVSSVYKATDPMTQIREIIELFDPIKDKILAITTGNHEARTERESGVDVSELVARQFNIFDRYAEDGAVLFVRVGRGGSHGRPICYTIYFTHGSGGGRLAGGKINRLLNLASIVDADVYVHSHTHTPAIVRQSFYRVDVHNNSVAPVDKLFVNTGSALEYGGYGQRAGYIPASNRTPVIHLNGRVKDATATV